MNNVYCVCTTPTGYRSYNANWLSFPNPFTYIIDSTNEQLNLENAFYFTEKDLIDNFNLPQKPSSQHYWNIYNDKNIVWFYAHYRMLNFYLKNNAYDYYWFFDDDLAAANWSLFFEKFDTDDSDFISYFCFKNKNVFDQPNVPTIDSRTYSDESWFQRFPGDGDIIPTTACLFGSFFPAVRFSNKALQTLLFLNEKKYLGYSEGFVPTMLNYCNLKLSTIINSDNTSNYFDVSLVDLMHKNTKITWQWI